MAGINEMDLDNDNFIDSVAFDQSKAILDNAMEDLNHYLRLFNKGDFKAFPRAKLDQWLQSFILIPAHHNRTTIHHNRTTTTLQSHNHNAQTAT